MRKPSARTALPIGAALLAVSAAASAVHPFGAARLPASTAALFQGAHSDSDAARIFATACANCHSERTVWPWYSHLAPVSWVLEHDVAEARAHLNASRWESYRAEERIALLSKLAVMIRTRRMPPGRYTLVHAEARLPEDERARLADWARTERRAEHQKHQ